MIRHWTLAAGLVLAATAAHAQAVIQSGPWQLGHAPMYVGGGNGGVPPVMDAGNASGYSVAGTTGTGFSETLQKNRSPLPGSGSGPLGAHNCAYSTPDAPLSATFSYFCVDANIGGNPAIVVGGNPPVSGLSVWINGIEHTFSPATGASPQCVNPVAYGADPNGVADSTAAFNAAVVAGMTSAGVCIEFPPGTFKSATGYTITIPNGTVSATVKGSGTAVTRLYMPNTVTAGLHFIRGTGPSFAQGQITHVSDLAILTGAVDGGIGLLDTSGASGSNVGTDRINLIVAGNTTSQYWTKGIEEDARAVTSGGNPGFVNYSNVNITGGSAQGTHGLGIGVQLLGPNDSAFSAIEYNFSTPFFGFLAVGLDTGPKDVQGITLSQANWVNGGIGIRIPSGGTVEVLTVENGSQFGGGDNAIEIDGTLEGLWVQNSLFYVQSTSGPTSAIHVNAGGSLDDLSFQNNQAYGGFGAGGNYLINFSGGSSGVRGLISGNIINTFAFGVNLQGSGTTNVRDYSVYGNNFQNVAQPFIDSTNADNNRSFDLNGKSALLLDSSDNLLVGAAGVNSVYINTPFHTYAGLDIGTGFGLSLAGTPVLNLGTADVELGITAVGSGTNVSVTGTGDLRVPATVTATDFASAGQFGISTSATVSGCTLTYTKGLLTAVGGSC
jgi:hypothetical protein